MAFTGYFKTEKLQFGSPEYSLVNTSINQPTNTNRYTTSQMIISEIEVNYTALGTIIYMQNEVSSGSYKVLDKIASDGPEVEYSSTDTSVSIYRCISSGSFFTEDQDFDAQNVNWSVTYSSKVFDIPNGRTPFIRFDFYKVDPSGSFTFLFNEKVFTSIFYPVNGVSIIIAPSGEVTTLDQLAIEVFYGSDIPGK